MILSFDTGKNIGLCVMKCKAIHTYKFILNNPEEILSKINFLTNIQESIIYIEDYMIYNSPKSIISAISGDLKFVIKTGIILEKYFKDLKAKRVIMVSPRWKGTMNDKQVKERIKYCMKKYKFNLEFEKRKLSSHEWDAIGMALNGLGLFNSGK